MQTVAKPGSFEVRLVPLTCAILVAAFVSPLASLFLICFLTAVLPDRGSPLIFLVAAMALLATINMLKELQGDLANYVALQGYFTDRLPTVLMDEGQLVGLTGSYRRSEIGFYGVMWLLAQIVPNERIAIAIVASFGIYLPTFLGLKIVNKRQQWNDGHFIAMLFFFFFASINFVQTTHLLRQYVSSSLVFLAFAIFLSGRRLRAFWIIAFACIVHNGTVILVASIALLSLLFPLGTFLAGNRGGLLVRIFAGGALFVVAFYLGALEQLQGFTSDESNIGPIHYISVGLIFATYWLFGKKPDAEDASMHYVTIAMLSVYLLSLAFYVVGARLFALRYFAYLEWLFGFMVGAILLSLPRARLGLQQFARWGLCVASAGIFLWRIQVAPWAYAGEGVGIFAKNFFALMAFVGR